ncbi:LacI family DNA-binding transcriptional regulator [Phycisphaerales bacterium AB-hyl4]|uniref:LacI family DNA-binding transcriptional regulator n=1 Tax=Natronomicrosphaera hydrolytica TaxID=3242702 RepID=A0ABV4U4F0_9BACT
MSDEVAGVEASPRRATILDVARAADVAPSTVSLVTNGTGYVSEEKRRVIEEVVRQVGYRPRGRRKTTSATPATRSASRSSASSSASPSSAQTRTLDVVVLYVPMRGRAGAITATVVSVLEGANTAFAARQIRPSLIAAADHIDDDAILLSHLRSRQIDGAILMGVGRGSDPGYIQHLDAANVPCVFVGHRATEQGVSSVNADFFRGSVLAAEHLQGLGHQRIGFVGFSEAHWPTAERLRGYQQTLKQHGLPVDEPYYTHGVKAGQHEEAMSAYLRSALDRGCTGFLMGDFYAELAVPILEGFGCDVPGDVSIVGFDHLGHKVGRRSLALTSVAYDKPFLGVTAVQTLLEIIESDGRLTAANKTIGVNLYQGATTAAAAGASQS